MNDEQKDQLLEKLAKYQKFSYKWGKKLSIGYLGMLKSSIEFAIMAAIFFYIYHIAGRDFTFVLLAIGVILYGLRNKGEVAVLQYENKKLEEQIKGVGK